MNRETSVYLDLVRFTAAVIVFLGHASAERVSAGLLWQFQGHGREAVDVFFVLSGFVIAYVVDTREGTALEFGVSRAARLYSVALPVLVVTFVLDRIGQSLRPELYHAWCCDSAGSESWQFLGSLFFLNEIWSHHSPPGSAAPYWSLGYEAFYYLAFGLAWFLRRPWNLLAAAAALVAAGPGIAVLFPLWLLGFLCYRLCARVVLPFPAGLALCLGALLLFVGYEAVAYRNGEIYEAFALTPARLHDYGQDYIVGVLFAVHLVGFRVISPALAAPLARIRRPVRWLAGATLSLYLFHMPLIHVLAAVSPLPANAWPTRAMVFVVVPLTALALAELTERRKQLWRHAILALPGFGPARALEQGKGS